MTQPPRHHKHAPYQMTVSLHSIHDLFVPSSRNPLQDNYMPMSGIEQIALKLKLVHLKYGLHVTFVLPRSAGEPAALKQEISAGLKRYCDAALSNLAIEVEAKNMSVVRSLQVGMGILALSLALAAAVSNSTFLADWLRNLLSNSISIFGSVALWSPTDQFLFGIRPLYKNVKIYKTISKMDFDVQLANSEPAPAAVIASPLRVEA